MINPLRRWVQNPEKILAPYIHEGMTVLEIGPGMGFFTIPAAGMVGKSGRVIAVDIQEKMLTALARRTERAGLAERVVTRLCKEDDLAVSEPIDLCLALNVVHEVPNPRSLFLQIREILKPTGRLFLAEPAGWHVSDEEFQDTLSLARAIGFRLVGGPKMRRSRTALFALE